MKYIDYNKPLIKVLLVVTPLTLVITLVILASHIVKRNELSTYYVAVEPRDYGVTSVKSKYNLKTPTGSVEYNPFPAEIPQEEMPSYEQSYQTIQVYKTETEMQSDVSDINAYLYSLCDKYYQVYYGDSRVSPLYPLAAANVETPERADNKITWSALFPSRYVDINLIDSFDVTYIAQDPATYNALMHESSTRDRGALQMSPTYGTKSEKFNSLMTGTEATKLSTIQIHPDATLWARGASTYPGDRFNIKDVLYRLSSADEDALNDLMNKNIVLKNDAELVIMMAMYHHRSGVWHVDGAGGWKANDAALHYAEKLSDQSQIDRIVQWYNMNSDQYTINSDTAASLMNFDWKEYTTSAAEAVYPVKVLYSYIVMQNLYGKH